MHECARFLAVKIEVIFAYLPNILTVFRLDQGWWFFAREALDSFGSFSFALISPWRRATMGSGGLTAHFFGLIRSDLV